MSTTIERRQTAIMFTDIVGYSLLFNNIEDEAYHSDVEIPLFLHPSKLLKFPDGKCNITYLILPKFTYA